MAEHYPELTFGTDPLTGMEAFEGVLALLSPRSGLVRRIPLRIVFPAGFPDDEPRAFDYSERFLPHNALRHFYEADGRCCLWLPWESGWQANKADCLLDFMVHVAVFFNHQILFDISGKWPVPWRGHGPAGYREFLVGKLGIADDQFPQFVPMLMDGASVAYLVCPCGSGKQAKRCHLVVVNELLSRIGRTRLRDQVVRIVEIQARSGQALPVGALGESKFA